jgi:hypothetical protein
MFKKMSKYLIFSNVLIVFSLLLVSCQSKIASTEEMESDGYAYLQVGVPLIELTSDVPAEAEVMVDTLTAGGKIYFERYLEEMESEGYAFLQASGPLIELRSDVPAEAEVMVMESEGYAFLQVGVPLIELTSDVPAEAEVMADAFTPGIEIRRTRLQARTFLTVYTVMSDGPGWVVFHADEDGVPGKILKYIWVSDGISRINVVEVLEEMSSEQIHVMLHHDFGWTGYFEFPRTDEPVMVDNEIVNALCFCPF